MLTLFVELILARGWRGGEVRYLLRRRRRGKLNELAAGCGEHCVRACAWNWLMCDSSVGENAHTMRVAR